jgi:hypothetical protein
MAAKATPANQDGKLCRKSANRIEQVFWTGAKYAVTDKVDVMGGYYHSLRFGAIYCSDASKSTCSGTFDAYSVAVDWKFAAKFDAYAGFMYSQVNNGLANVPPSHRHRSYRRCPFPILRKAMGLIDRAGLVPSNQQEDRQPAAPADGGRGHTRTGREC